MEKDILESWLGFLKFFLGTFVIGLLGFFAKLSYENRQMAVTESEQIGKYVENAMLNDIESRLRFAEYFSTVLPEGHTTGWTKYYQKLRLQEAEKAEAERKQKEQLDSVNDILLANEELAQAPDSLLTEQDSQRIEENNRKMEALLANVDAMQKKIDQAQSLKRESVNENEASIGNNGIVTCRKVQNLMPYNRTTKFRVNERVYVHAFINSPRKERLTILWKDANDDELRSSERALGVNTDRGYRIFDYTQFKESGTYSVEMINQSGNVIGERTFTIN
ncbi:MAG: hypothetical protein HKP24_04470 [Croceitalea sp.]|nr:hypothetical protein [Croceitalea sp.]